jgi:YjbE family integral membrane protein
MSFFGLPDGVGKPLAVVLIDLLLASDNALAIALVCLSLSPRNLRWVLGFGTLAAVLLRVLLAGFAGWLLVVPGLKLTGGLLLALLAANLARPDRRPPPALPATDARGGILAAVVVVALVDVLMSLDNVIALAAVAGDSIAYLTLGLLLSVSILMFGSVAVGRLLRRHPWLSRLGVAVLGWVAGQMMVSDAAVAGWVATQSPALAVVLPALMAVYVYVLAGAAGHGATAAALPPTLAPPPPPPRRPVAPPPRRPAPALPEPRPLEVNRAGASRSELVLFLALFIVAGAVIGVIGLFGGGLFR